jgi:hypothetical protein
MKIRKASGKSHKPVKKLGKMPGKVHTSRKIKH